MTTIINVVEHSNSNTLQRMKAMGLSLLVMCSVALVAGLLPPRQRSPLLDPPAPITTASTRELDAIIVATTQTKKPTSTPDSNNPTRKPSITAKPTKKLTSNPVSKSPTRKPNVTAKPTTTTRKPTQKPVSKNPTRKPSLTPVSKSPTNKPTSTSKPTTRRPTSKPILSKPTEPITPKPFYFNYNTTAGSRYGPSAWGNINTTNNYWSEFGFTKNQCNDKAVMQSPIDLCTAPEKHCLEYHEPRSHGGNFRLTDQFMTKRILPNKLHIHVVRKVANQTIPPSFDFSGVGAQALDLLNIDIKFPSEHTVCGQRFDGEMQYIFYHPVKNAFIVVAWLFEVKVSNPINPHMQRLIDEFQEIYDMNEEICRQKSANESMTQPRSYSSVLVVEPLWNPFHRDIQKTIHFWGYAGSLTEPPCAANTLWRIMDVPVQLSTDQLNQMQNVLFNNRDSGTCAFTSNHYKGSVARPINEPLSYYKCTRQDYKSDDERELCGDKGCAVPFGTNLDPWVPPIVDVTAPPSFAPTDLPL